MLTTNKSKWLNSPVFSKYVDLS